MRPAALEQMINKLNEYLLNPEYTPLGKQIDKVMYNLILDDITADDEAAIFKETGFKLVSKSPGLVRTVYTFAYTGTTIEL